MANWTQILGIVIGILVLTYWLPWFFGFIKRLLTKKK